MPRLGHLLCGAALGLPAGSWLTSSRHLAALVFFSLAFLVAGITVAGRAD